MLFFADFCVNVGHVASGIRVLFVDRTYRCIMFGDSRCLGETNGILWRAHGAFYERSSLKKSSDRLQPEPDHKLNQTLSEQAVFRQTFSIVNLTEPA